VCWLEPTLWLRGKYSMRLGLINFRSGTTMENINFHLIVDQITSQSERLHGKGYTGQDRK